MMVSTAIKANVTCLLVEDIEEVFEHQIGSKELP
jgi:hypothetical protein